MVVDACFIASQIDVWTQAYNGPTSRRKYVLNLLNVLHKNVTEEYKTDQFLHVIYWFLIYKSNLGHFFRNEGIFPPTSSSSSSTNFSVHRPCLLVRCLQASPPPGHASVPTWVPTCGACSYPAACTCTRRYVWKLQTLGGRANVISAPSVGPPPFEAENLGRSANKRTQGGMWHLSDLVPLGSCLSGLFSPGRRLASWVTGAEKESESLRNKN